MFDPLDREQIGAIVDLQVARLRDAGRRARDRVELTDDARTLIGNLGYDPVYGARPLKRVIQKRLVDPLALRILDGTFATGDTVVATRRTATSSCARRATAALRRSPPDRRPRRRVS